MYKRFALFIALVLVVPFVLAACGGDKLSTDDAEKAVKAAIEGDIDTANEYVCDAEKLTEADFEGVEIPEGMTVDVSCSESGDNMSCDLTVSMEVEGETQEFSNTIELPVEDGKLCGDFDTPGGS